MKTNGIYTIANIYNITGARGGLKIYYKYYYLGKRYEAYAVGSDYTLSDEGKRFFVKILGRDPDRCKMTDIYIPDSIAEAPYEGWNKLPVKVDKKDLPRFYE